MYTVIQQLLAVLSNPVAYGLLVHLTDEQTAGIVRLALMVLAAIMKPPCSNGDSSRN